MTDQTRWGIDEVQQRNKAIAYDKKNTKKLHEAQDIFKETNGLDNISKGWYCVKLWAKKKPYRYCYR